MLRRIFIPFLVLIVFEATAQTFSGRVTDSSTQLPLYPAHITCEETGEGTLTDEAGNFRLILKDFGGSKNLVVSYVGYQTIKQSISNPGAILAFELTPDTTVLKSIEITSPDPIELIRLALSKVKENHGGQRLLTCFYRKVTKNKERYIQVSEGAYELNQYPSKYNQLKVLKAREAEDDKAFNGVGMGIGTPAGAVRNMDFTMNPEESFLKPENLKKHDFFYEGITTRGGVEVHEISFDQKKNKEALYKGKLYLHTTSLAFVAVTYGLSQKGIAHFHAGNAAERAAMKLLDIHIDLKADEQTITYRPFGKKWYLDHAVTSENVDVSSRRFNFDVPVTERSEVLVTRIDTTFLQAFAEETLTLRGFIESAADTAKGFWEDHNTIPSQTDYTAIAREIESRNGYSFVKAHIKERLKDLPKDKGIRVDSVLSYYHARGLFNGTALVQHKGQVILHKGYGYADKERQVKNDTATAFRIGSIAKTFTSRIIWHLKEEGLLQYHDTLQRFIPWYPHHGITLHHLLTHTSGIPNYMAQANFLDSIQYRFTIEALVRHFGVEKPAFTPGSEFSYSNTGYTLLALIAEKASGKSYGALFEEKIVKPLRLGSTSFARHDNAHMAKGYLGETVEPYYYTGNVAGAGAISSTAADLLKWHNAHYDHNLEELFIPRSWYHDWGAHYGYGWNIDKYQFWASKRHTIQYHGGTDFGFKSMMARQPDKDNLVILLNNMGEFPLFDITDLVLNIIN